MIPRLLTVLTLFLVLGVNAHAEDAAAPAKAPAEQKPQQEKPKRKGPPPVDPSVYGPFIGTSMKLPNDVNGENRVFRGIIIPLNDDLSKGVVFDGDTLRMAAGWLEGGVLLRGLPFTGHHGKTPEFLGTPLFVNLATPGWGDAKGSVADPREGDYPRLGNIPESTADFKGVYRHGSKVILSYTVQGTPVLETPELETKGEQEAISRHFELGPHAKDLKLVVGYSTNAVANGRTAQLGDTGVAIAGGPKDSAMFSVEEDRVVLAIPGSRDKQSFKVFYAKGDASAFISKGEKPGELASLTKGGPRIFTETITTNGVVAESTGPFVVDSITVPDDNPYGVNMRTAAFDFFSDGKRAAVSTWDGDVWIVSGIDESLEKVTWTRFASGAHEPMGLKIVDDVIYTVDDAQITRYHDLNDDGQADFFENFCNDWDLTEGFHAFCFDLQTDKKGNFYFAFGAPVRGGGRSFERIGRHHGSIIKIDKHGKNLERYATGFRAPNGMCVSPDGQVTSGDNEGTFVPRSPINWVKEGGFHGVVDTYAHHDQLKTTATKPELNNGRPQHLEPSEMPKPLMWLPKSVDNSGGGQVWVTNDKWGPFKDRLLHLSYGQSSVYLVLPEDKDGQMQGGVTKIPVKLTSSAMRARINPADGQVYVCGLKGWQTNAAKPAGFDRIRYTGKPVNMVDSLHVKPGGIMIGFTCSLDDELANDPTSFALKGNNIVWSHNYGSNKTPVEMAVKSAELQPDGKSVWLEIPDLAPIHMLEISIDVESKDGDEIFTKVWSTIHAVN